MRMNEAASFSMDIIMMRNKGYLEQACSFVACPKLFQACCICDSQNSASPALKPTQHQLLKAACRNFMQR